MVLCLSSVGAVDVVVDVVVDHDDAHQEGTQEHSSGVLGLCVSRR